MMRITTKDTRDTKARTVCSLIRFERIAKSNGVHQHGHEEHMAKTAYSFVSFVVDRQRSLFGRQLP